MAIEQIKKVKEAEDQGLDIRRKSESEAKRVLEEAEKEAALTIEKAQREGEDLYRAHLSKAREEAESYYQSILEKGQADCNKILAGAEHNMEGAVSLIVGRVVR